MELNVGRGRGRGRRLLGLGMPWDVNMNIEDIIITGGSSTSSVTAPSTPSPSVSVVNGHGRLIEVNDSDDDDDAKSYTSSLSSSSTVSDSSVAPLVVKAPIGFGVNVPSRLLDQVEKVPFKAVAVDSEQQLAYIRFEDEMTQELRKDLTKEIDRVYKSDKRLDLAVPRKEIAKNNVYVIKAENGNLHRAMVVSLHSADGVQLVDVDTYEQLFVRKLEAFQMTMELMDYWFQVIACTFGYGDSTLTNQWKKENNFIFKNTMMMEQVLLSMVETNVEKTFLATNIQKEEVNRKDVLRLSINITETPKTEETFLHAFMFYTLPRLPIAGETKIAFITNVKETGLVDVVFTDKLYYELQEVLNSIQIANQLFAPQCPCMNRYLREMVCSYNHKRYLAPLDGNWNELHRCKIIGVLQDKGVKSVKLSFLDSGKLLCVPINNLSNLALPMHSRTVPFLLDLIPPQAITLQVNNIEQRDIPKLLELRHVLEGSTCIVKSNSVDSDTPTVEIFTTFKGKVLPLVDIVRSGGDEEEQARDNELTPDDIRMEEERELELQGYNVIPLERFEKRLEDIRKKGRDKLDEARRKLQGGGCACCTESAMEEQFSGLQLDVYSHLGFSG